MKKKIGLVLPTRPQDGGQHRYALLVMQCLVAKADIYYDLVVLGGNSFWKRWCRKGGVRYLGNSIPNISLMEQKFNESFPLLAKWYYTYLTPFGKVIREEKIDILFSIHQGIFIPNYNVKIISPVHDLMHRYEPNFPEVQDSFIQREIYMKSYAKYAACILVDSKLGKKQFIESYIKRYVGRPYVVRLPFVASEDIQNSKEEYIEVPDKYVFYPAQFWQHKNHLNLIRAIKILSQSIKDIHLVLVGEEKNCCKTVKRYIVDNQLEDHITILGFVSNENLTYLYRHAAGMIMPSYFGPTNIPPLEAMALGCPVAVSNKYAMPEQVGSAGLLFDPDSPEEMASCILRLWTDEELRKQMIKHGYQRVQKWTEREFAQKLYKIIDRL